MKQDIYKDHYQFEWDQKSHLTLAMNIPIAVATVIGGALTVMAQKYPYSQAPLSWVFVCLLILSAISIFVSVFFIFRAIHGYEYKRIPTPQNFKLFHDKLCEWHNKYGENPEDAEKEFEDNFNLRMSEATEVNAHNNKNKSAYLYRTNIALAIALLFIAVSSVPYLIGTINGEKEIYSVQITEPINIVTKENVMTENEQEQKPATDQPPEVIPPKPVAPPNENIKEHVVEPTTKKVIRER